MPGFVGIKKSVSTEELQTLLERLENPDCYYCLRWHHRVSDIVKKLHEAFPTPEGRMFDADRELRWRQLSGDTYSLLLLSKTEKALGEAAVEFEPLIGTWEYEDRASCADRDLEAHLPGNVVRKFEEIGQRYFRDGDTATVHFIALTIIERS